MSLVNVVVGTDAGVEAAGSVVTGAGVGVGVEEDRATKVGVGVGASTRVTVGLGEAVGVIAGVSAGSEAGIGDGMDVGEDTGPVAVSPPQAAMIPANAKAMNSAFIYRLTLRSLHVTPPVRSAQGSRSMDSSATNQLQTHPSLKSG